METDDPKAMAALLATARDVLRSRVQPHLQGEAKLDAAMIANAMGLVVRALQDPGASWSAQASGDTGVEALRAHVKRRLAVTNPGYAEQVRDAPP